MQAPIITGISLNSDNQLTVNATNFSKIEVTKQGANPVEFTDNIPAVLDLSDGLNSYTVAAVQDVTTSEYFPKIVNSQKLNIIQAETNISTVTGIPLGEKAADGSFYKTAVDSTGKTVELNVNSAITEEDGTATLDPSKLEIGGKIITITLHDDTIITLVFPGITDETTNTNEDVQVTLPEEALKTGEDICLSISETKTENNVETTSYPTLTMTPAAVSTTSEDNNDTCFTLTDEAHGDTTAIVTGTLSNNSKLDIHTAVISSTKTQDELLSILPDDNVNLEDLNKAAEDAQTALDNLNLDENASEEDKAVAQKAVDDAQAAKEEAESTQAAKEEAAKKYSEAKNAIKLNRDSKKEAREEKAAIAAQAALDLQNAQDAFGAAQLAFHVKGEGTDEALKEALNEAEADLEKSQSDHRKALESVEAAKQDLNNLNINEVVPSMASTINALVEQFNREDVENEAKAEKQTAIAVLATAKAAYDNAPEEEKAAKAAEVKAAEEAKAEAEAKVKQEEQKSKQIKRDTAFNVIFNNMDTLNEGVTEDEDKVKAFVFTKNDFPDLGVKKATVRAMKTTTGVTSLKTAVNEAFVIKMEIGHTLTINEAVRIIQQAADTPGFKKFHLENLNNTVITYGENFTKLTQPISPPEFEGTMKLNVGNTQLLLGSVTDVTATEPVVQDVEKTITLKYSPGQEQPKTVNIFLDYTDGQDYTLDTNGEKIFKKVQLREPVPIWQKKGTDETVSQAVHPGPDTYERKLDSSKQRRDERELAQHGAGPNPTYGFYAWWYVDPNNEADSRIEYLPISANFVDNSNADTVAEHVTKFFTSEQQTKWNAQQYTVYTDDFKLRSEVFEGAVDDDVTELVWRIQGMGVDSQTLYPIDPSTPDGIQFEPVYKQISETQYLWVEYAKDDQGEATDQLISGQPVASKAMPTTSSEMVLNDPLSYPHGSIWKEWLSKLDSTKNESSWTIANAQTVQNGGQIRIPLIQGEVIMYLTKNPADNDTKWEYIPDQKNGVYEPVYEEHKGQFTISNYRTLNSTGDKLDDAGTFVNSSGDGLDLNANSATIDDNQLSYVAKVFGDSQHFDYKVSDTEKEPNESNVATYKLNVVSLLEMMGNHEHKIPVEVLNATDEKFSLKFSDKFFTGEVKNAENEVIESHKYRYKLKYYNITADEDVIKITEKINAESLKNEILAFINTDINEVEKQASGASTLWPKNFITYDAMDPNDAGTIQINNIRNFDFRPDEEKAGLEVSRLDFVILGPEFENVNLTIKDSDKIAADEEITDAGGIITVLGNSTSGNDMDWNSYFTTAIDLSVDEYRLLAGAGENNTPPAQIRSLFVTYQATVRVENGDGSFSDTLRSSTININVIGTNSAPELSFDSGLSGLDMYSSKTVDEITSIQLFTNNLNVFSINVVDNEDSEFTGIATIMYKATAEDTFAVYDGNEDDESFLYTTDGTVSTDNLATVAHSINKTDSNYLLTRNLKVGFWSVTYTVTDTGGKSSSQQFNIEVTDDTQVKVESNELSYFTVGGTFISRNEDDFWYDVSVVTRLDTTRLPANITADDVLTAVDNEYYNLVKMSGHVFNADREEGKDSITCSVNTKLLEFLSKGESLFFFVDIAPFKDSASFITLTNAHSQGYIDVPSDRLSHNTYRRVVLEVKGEVSGVTINVTERINLTPKDAVLTNRGNWEWSIDMNNIATTIDKNANVSISNDPAPNLFRCKEVKLAKDTLFTSSDSNALGLKYIKLLSTVDGEVKTSDNMRANMYVFDTEFTVQKSLKPSINLDYKDAKGMVIFTVGQKKTKKNNSTTDLIKRWKNLENIDLSEDHYYVLGNDTLTEKDKIQFNIPASWDSDIKLQVGIIFINLGRAPAKFHINSLSVEDQLDVSHSLSISKEDSSKLIFRTKSGTNNGNTYYKCNITFNAGSSTIFSINTPLLHSKQLTDHMSNMPVKLKKPVVESYEFSYSDNLELRADGNFYVKAGFTGYQKVFSKITRRPLSITGVSTSSKLSTIDCKYLNVKQATALVDEEKEAQ